MKKLNLLLTLLGLSIISFSIILAYKKTFSNEISQPVEITTFDISTIEKEVAKKYLASDQYKKDVAFMIETGRDLNPRIETDIKIKDNWMRGSLNYNVSSYFKGTNREALSYFGAYDFLAKKLKDGSYEVHVEDSVLASDYSNEWLNLLENVPPELREFNVDYPSNPIYRITSIKEAITNKLKDRSQIKENTAIYYNYDHSNLEIKAYKNWITGVYIYKDPKGNLDLNVKFIQRLNDRLYDTDIAIYPYEKDKWNDFYQELPPQLR